MNESSENHIRVFVIVPVFNRSKLIVDYLNRMKNQTYKWIQVIIVNDRSTDDTVSLIESNFSNWGNWTIINTEGNSWWGGCVHEGIKHVKLVAKKSDLILLMNDDVTFENTLIEGFLAAHLKNPNAVLSAVPISDGRIAGPGSVMVFWPLAITRRPFGNHPWPSNKLPSLISVDFQFAHATLYPLHVVESIGDIAYKTLPHYHGDGEYSYRAKKKGFPSFVLTSVPIYIITGSTGMFNCKSTRYMWRDLLPSFFEFKSINNIHHRIAFARLAAPRYAQNIYIVSQTFKSLVRSLLILIRPILHFKESR